MFFDKVYDGLSEIFVDDFEKTSVGRPHYGSKMYHEIAVWYFLLEFFGRVGLIVLDDVVAGQFIEQAATDETF